MQQTDSKYLRSSTQSCPLASAVFKLYVCNNGAQIKQEQTVSALTHLCANLMVFDHYDCTHHGPRADLFLAILRVNGSVKISVS